MTIVYKIEDFKFQYPNSKLSISINGCLNINHGDIILLQGNSGSGKSTLLLALKGIIPNLIYGNLSGQILFHNQNITQLENTPQIGYLGQNPHNQLVCTQVYEELALGLENQCIDPLIIKQKIIHYSKRFNVTHLLNREISTLSGGEKQKINLLAILIMEPEVLLLDEPTAFLDPENAHAIVSIIQEYSRQKTVIIIEHNIHYLQQLINRAILISQSGQIIEQSPLEINFFPHLADQSCKSATTGNNKPALLTINNLNFSYKNCPALLKNLCLTLYAGQIIGIIGKNGSGKSSLLKLMSKILPSKNNIYYKQQDIMRIKTNKYWQDIGLLWQNPENHFLYQSVNQELENNPTVIAQFDLSKCATHNPYCLSEGQKRRLSMAINMKPTIQLFLLDEPTFGQDFPNKEKLCRLISMLALANKSFIIVSHDIPFLQALTKDIYKLDEGRLIL